MPLLGKKRGMQMQELEEQRIAIPTHFRCPISLDLMRDPVTLCTGITYDRSSIERWIDNCEPATCPSSRQLLWDTSLVPNHTLRRVIQDWCVANRSKGVERIPTPRQPLDAQRVADLTARIQLPCERLAALKDARAIAARGPGDRSRRLLATGGAAAAARAALAEEWRQQRRLECIEDALAVMVNLAGDPGIGDDDVITEAAAWVLARGTCEGKVNAAAYVEALCGSGAATVVDLGGDAIAALVDMSRDRLYKRAARGGLAALQAAAARSRRNGAHAVRAGAVSALLELLPDAGRRPAELALAAIEELCKCKEGVAALAEHPLSGPLLVGNILAGSEQATEHAVAALWLLLAGMDVVVKSPKARDAVIDEVILAGGFNQVLLILQADVTLHTKHRARELLKSLKQPWAQHPCAPQLRKTIF